MFTPIELAVIAPVWAEKQKGVSDREYEYEEGVEKPVGKRVKER